MESAERKEFYKKMKVLAVPITLQNLMLASVAAADAFMLGSVEQNAMSAVSLASQIQFVQNMLVMSVVSVIGLLGAQYWGKEDKRTLGDIFNIGLKVSFITSFIFFIGCIFFPRYLMLLFTNEEELIAIGINYLKIAGWSYLLTGISQCYLALMKVSEHASMTAVISSSAVVINIILNGIFIFGLLGLPVMGVEGAARATLIARAIELLWCIIISHKKGYMHIEWGRFFKVNKLLVSDFLKCLFPLVGAGMFWAVGFTSYTAFIGHLGTDATAANSVASVVRDLVCCVCNGLAGATGIMVGNELGAGNLDKGKRFGIAFMKLSYVCGFASTAVMLLLTPAILSFVKLTEGAHDYLLGMMVIMAIYMIGRCVNTITINGVFTAGGDTMYDFYSLAVCMWGLAVPLAALGTFVFHWPVLVVYACTCLDEVGKIPWVMYHFSKYKWVKDLTRDINDEAA